MKKKRLPRVTKTTATLPSALKADAQRGTNLPVRRRPPPPSAAMTKALQLAKSFQPQLQRATTATQRKTAVARLRAVAAEWSRLAPGLRADGAAWDQAREKLRDKFRRELNRTFPAHRRLEALRQLRSRQVRLELAKLPEFTVGTVGGVLLPDEPRPTIFTAPYLVHDVHTRGDQDGHIKFTDRSFVLRDTGQLIVDADLDNNENTAFSDGLLGLLYVNSGHVAASCGVAYTLPSTGRLRVGAELRNFYNHVILTMTDKFGFSSGDLHTGVTVFLTVVRPSRSEEVHSLLTSRHLTSDGGERHDVLPDIEQGVPLTSEFVTEETYDAGESVWILVGTSLFMVSTLDDMRSHVRGLLWSQLRQIAVSVVP